MWDKNVFLLTLYQICSCSMNGIILIITVSYIFQKKKNVSYVPKYSFHFKLFKSYSRQKLYHSLVCLNNGKLLPKAYSLVPFHSVAYFILYTTLLCYNIVYKFLRSFLSLLFTHSHTPGVLIFIFFLIISSVVPILNSSFHSFIT